MNERNAGQAYRFNKEKQALEVALCLDMLEIFNDESMGLIGKVRDLILAAGQDMAVRAGSGAKSKSGKTFDQLWMTDWTNYAGAKAIGFGTGDAWNYKTFERNVRQIRAEHCGDLIRIYGEVIEQLGSAVDNQARTAPQKGIAGTWDKLDANANKSSNSTGAQMDKLRRRVVGASNPLEGDYSARQPESFKLMTSMPSSGIKRWNIEDNDLIGKMDRAFGLMLGATISGTTTDNIYFMMKFGGHLLDPIFYLLPVATIAGGGHHSLLEVAYPLSLNGLIDYKIGMYSTLMPKRGAKGAVGPDSGGARQIERLLANYQNHEWNRYITHFYDDGASYPAGCFQYDTAEWKRFSDANERMLNLFKNMPAWPTKKLVKAIPARLAFGM